MRAARDDREILLDLHRRERDLQVLYASLAEDGADRATARLFGEDCAEHARGLSIALSNRGSAPAGQVPTEPRSAALDAALGLEEETVAAYYRAHAHFEDLVLLPTLTSIMANHGQHLAVLRGRLGERPATLAFETGAGE